MSVALEEDNVLQDTYRQDAETSVALYHLCYLGVNILQDEAQYAKGGTNLKALPQGFDLSDQLLVVATQLIVLLAHLMQLCSNHIFLLASVIGMLLQVVTVCLNLLHLHGRIASTISSNRNASAAS